MKRVLVAGDLIVDHNSRSLRESRPRTRRTRRRPAWPGAGAGRGISQTSPLGRGDTALAALVPVCADRLTVVCSATALRARGAILSEGLSWDQALEDTLAEF